MINVKIPTTEASQFALGAVSNLESQITEYSSTIDRLKRKLRENKKTAIRRFRSMQSSMREMRETENWEKLHRMTSSMRSDKENIGYCSDGLKQYIERYDEATADIEVTELSLTDTQYAVTCIDDSVMISIFTPYGATINLDCFGEMGASVEVTSKNLQPYYNSSEMLTTINLNTMIIGNADSGATLQQRVDQCIKICKDCYSQSIQQEDDEEVIYLDDDPEF